ncbi:hypothetical protein HYS31_05140, partial [Candidatus Woesearchaeota archaeon]|nr:hypothetical protein [Candidatus Woesearchaeota archaeon]
MLKRGLIIAKSIVFVFVLAVFGAFNVFAQSSSCTGFINYIPQEGDDGTETFWTYAILWDITDCQNNLICVKREDETSYKPFTGLIPTQGHITGNDNAPWIVCDKNYEFAVFPASQAQGDRCTGNPITGVPIKNVKRICIRSGIFGGQVSIVNNILIEPNPVIQGQSFTTTFQGSGLNSMWFDVKIRFASATGEGTEYQNWQQGVIGEHPADITGSFVITGVRPHQNRNDHSGQYQQVSAAFTVSSATTTSDNMFDINNDGSVNQLDYTILQRVVLGQQECPISSCDLNDDGQVNILDLQRLISQIGGGTPSNRYDINNDGSVNNQDVQALQNVVYGAQCPIQSCDLNNDGVVNILDLQILISVVNPQTDCPSSLGLCNAETSNCKQTCKVNNQDVQYYCLGIFPQGNLPPDTWKWRTENEIKSACDSIGEACSQFVYPTRCTQMAGGDPRDPLSYGGKCFKTSGENNGPAWRYATEKVCSNGQAILPSQSCPSGSTPVDCNGNPISTLGSCTNTPCNANTLCITTCTENGQEKYCRSINNMNYRWMTVAEGKAECNNQQNCGKTTRCKINSGSSPTTFTCSYRAPPANDQNNPSYGWNFYQPSELNFLYDNENCGTFCNKCTGAYCSNGACIGGEQRIPLKISGTITINGAAYPNVDVYEAYNCVGTNCVTTKIGRSNGNGAVDFEDNWVTNRVSIYAPVVQNCHKNLGGLEVECSVLAANTYSVNVKYGTSAAELRTATASANYYFLDLSKNLGSPSQCAPLGNRLLSGQQCCSGVPCNGICQTICDFGGGGSCTAQQAGNRRCNTQVNAVELCTRAGAGYAWDQVEFCGSRRCTQSGNSVACESTTNCVPLNRNAVGTCCSGQRCSDGYCRSSCGTVQCTSGQKRCNNGNIEQCVSSSVGGASIRYEWLVTQQCSSGCAVVSGNPLCSGTPYCGNNIQTSDEECDGNNFGQLTDLRCSQFSSAYTSGMLRCSNCRIDTSNCVRGSDTTSTPYTFTVKVQDYSSPRKSATKTFTINLLGGGSSGLCTTCPSGYTPGVGGCDPACRYSTPPCAMPSIPCPTIGAGTCTDTDKDATYFDGINPNTRGRATGKDQVPHDDSCISNQPNKVTEWFCNNDGTVSSLQISCDSGKLCSNGACVSSPQPTGSCGNGQLETNLG